MNTLVYRTKKSPSSANNRTKVVNMISEDEELNNSELSKHLY